MWRQNRSEDSQLEGVESIIAKGCDVRNGLVRTFMHSKTDIRSLYCDTFCVFPCVSVAEF